MPSKYKGISLTTASSLVIANMVGTGVFTSLGFQLLGITDGFSILFLWLLGGIVSLSGALCYGELGVLFPRSGGEYNFLSKLFNPFIGFLSGWISSTVGFAAPVALASMLLGGYLSKVFFNVPQLFFSISVLVVITFVHSTNIKTGSSFQNIFTSLKVILILVIILAGLFFTNHQSIKFLPSSQSAKSIFSPAFAVSFFFVSYSYSGWNAASYLVDEIRDSKKNLPLSLIIGTGIVTVLYVFLNYTFLITAPISELVGQAEVAYFPAKYIFGINGAQIISILIALLLISSISSMVWAGPRVIKVMGEDVTALSFFAKKSKSGLPVNAIVVQSMISLLFIVTSTFEQVITYLGFTLNMFTFLTILGFLMYKLKNKQETTAYKVPLFPIVPLVFLLAGLWILIYGFVYKPKESLLGMLTLGYGAFFYWCQFPSTVFNILIKKSIKLSIFALILLLSFLFLL
jgi:APA family basic amino acid/polyamine antiporter